MTSFSVSSAVDLLAIVPYVIGFHPEDSAVLLTFGGPGSSPRDPGRSGRTVSPSFHARVDLPVSEHEHRATATMLREVVVRHRSSLVGLVLYTEDVAAASLFADLLTTGLRIDGVEILDVVRVEGDRFYCLDDPTDPGVPFDLREHPFTAAQVLAGRVVHDSRTALADSLIGTDGDDAALVATAASKVVDDLVDVGRSSDQIGATMVRHSRWLRTQVKRFVAGGPLPTAAEAGRMLVLVSFDSAREVAWSGMSRADAQRHVELWSDLVRRAPVDLRAGVGGLLGLAAWLHGDGALAWCALDRCFESDPDDSLGQHVAFLVESATPPSVWSPTPVASLKVLSRDQPQHGDQVRRLS
ncbi:MAG: hypothetical protein JWP74_2401 [Marmoricola sp.]|nr:hypothetical protein [Marmoricola sp.]